MSTLREWWTENPTASQQFYNEQLAMQGSAPSEAPVSVIRSIIQQHLLSPAMWAIFQIQDLFAMSETLRLNKPSEERINIPGDSKHYWKYRMPINLEDLMLEDQFNSDLRNLINSSNR
jgi:4-alpha-glucanotransferase